MATDTKPSSRCGQRRPASPGPLTNALISRIDNYGNRNALSRASGVELPVIQNFRKHLRGMMLGNIEVIAPFLGIKLARADGTADDKSTIRQVLMESINEFESINALSRAADLHDVIIRNFLHGRVQDLSRSTIDKLIVAMGLAVVIEDKAPVPEAQRPKPVPRVLSDAERRAKQGRCRISIADPIESEPIGSGLRSAFKATGRSLEWLIRATGLAHKTVADFMTNGRLPTLATAQIIADALGVGLIGEGDTRPGPLIETLRSKVVADPRSLCALARESRIHKESMCRFASHGKGLDLWSAERIAVVLKLKVVTKATDAREEPPEFDPLEVLMEDLRSKIRDSGRSTYELARAADTYEGNLRRFVRRERRLSLPTALKVFRALGVEPDMTQIRVLGPEKASPAQPCPIDGPPVTVPDPWDDWDEAICPVHVREDGHLVVFGEDKGPVRKNSARKLFEAIFAKYPGGFTRNELDRLEIATDFRGIMTRWRNRDDDCRAAIHVPGGKHGGLYRFGKPK